MEKSEEQTIKEMMKHHFEDDKKSFEKVYELLRINGEHTSYFTSNLESLKKTIDNLNESVNMQTKISIVNAEKLDAHIKRVEPMLSSYEKDTAFNVTLGEKSKKWSQYAIGTAGLIGAWYVVKTFIISIFMK